MKKHFTLSNILFVILIGLVLYPPSRIWITRQLSFTPAIDEIKKDETVTDYNWQLKGLNTSDVNFNQFKGKVVFLNFWATWCPPCVAELPYIQSFYNDYKDKVAFVFISKEDWSDINSFFKNEGYNFPVYQERNSSLEALPEVTSIPRTFIIDKEGNIRVDESGAADWNSAAFRKEIDVLLLK